MLASSRSSLRKEAPGSSDRVFMRMLLALFAMTIASSASAADVCRATSASTLQPLIELYTSEGCDSCPPADRWLTKHFPLDRTDGSIALAFHVDYWDRLGWKDRFATSAYTARQYQAMRANRSTFVYTPQVLLQGRDYAWRGASPDQAIATAATRAPKASMRMAAKVAGDALEADVDVTLDAPFKPSLVLSLAYADSGLTSDVKAGENRGVQLHHDHVVRAFSTHELKADRSNIKQRIERPAEQGSQATLVAFVQDTATGEVLQTLRMPLGDCTAR